MKLIFYSKFFIVLNIFAILFTSGYALSTVYPYGLYLRLLFAYIYTFPILIFYKKKVNMLLASFFLLLIMVIATVITTGDRALSLYLSILSSIVFAMGIVTVYDFEDFINIFLKIMVGVSAISLIGYFLVNTDYIILNLPLVENINSVPYKVGLLFFYIPWTPDRNLGVFWEPGLYATLLIIALMFELYYKNTKPNLVRVILFIVTIITTKSSAGYGLLLFIFLLVIINMFNFIQNEMLKRFLRFFCFAIAVIVLFNYSLVFALIGVGDNPLIQKIIGEQLLEQSRVSAIFHNLSMFAKNPVFGNGFTDSYSNIRFVADTSTSTFLLSVFGIFGIQYTFYWLLGILNDKNKNLLHNIMISIVFIIIVNKEPHHNLVLSWCFMFYFLKNSSLIRKRVN